MFFQLYKYKLKNILHTKEILFWNMCFPLILGTLFFFGFGNLMDGNDNEFAAIKVAVVTEQANDTFTEVLDTVSDDSDPLFEIVDTDNEANALSLLRNKDVDGVIYVNKKPHLAVSDNDINQTIIESFLNQYLAQATVIEDAFVNHPENMPKLLSALTRDVSYNKEISLANDDYDPYIQYFYALIAMACMYSSIAGVHCISAMQANQSAVGMRREASPQHKFTAIISDYLATVTVQFAITLVLLFYLNVVLGIDFGSKMLFIILTCLVGCIIGTSLGIFVGAIYRKELPAQVSLISGVTMIFCFLSGLMVENIKNIIEHTCPIINRINPATLITDCLYSLNMYDTYTRFTRDIVTMLVIAVILCTTSCLMLRRSRYASL